MTASDIAFSSARPDLPGRPIVVELREGDPTRTRIHPPAAIDGRELLAKPALSVDLAVEVSGVLRPCFVAVPGRHFPLSRF